MSEFKKSLQHLLYVSFDTYDVCNEVRKKILKKFFFSKFSDQSKSNISWKITYFQGVFLEGGPSRNFYKKSSAEKFFMSVLK